MPIAGGGWRYDLNALAEDRIFRASRARLPKTAEAAPAFKSMVTDLRGDSDDRLVLVCHRGLDRLIELLPSISMLHLVRDPRDVARSAIGMGWAGHVYYGARIWLQPEMEWERLAPRIADGQSLELRYEALVRNPEEVLAEICRFLGEQYEPGMLSYPDSSTYERPDQALTQQWRKKLSARELGLIEPLFGELLVRRGYELSGHSPVTPARTERLSIWLENKRSTWCFRIGRYGLRDPLIDALARRVGLPKLAAPARRRMQETSRKYLK